jgi:DNA recombination protein RmuC
VLIAIGGISFLVGVGLDAKSPVASYLEAVSRPTEEERRDGFRTHARALRSHMEGLARKNYWEQFERAPECVVMFIPGESFLAAALAEDATLLEDSYARRVLLAAPTTLIGLLLGVAQGWRQAAIEENAREISELGKVLHDRVRTLASHFLQLGRALGNATEQYNRTLASLESKVLGAARKFKELGAAAGDEIPELSGVDSVPRIAASLEPEDSAL